MWGELKERGYRGHLAIPKTFIAGHSMKMTYEHRGRKIELRGM